MDWRELPQEDDRAIIETLRRHRQQILVWTALNAALTLLNVGMAIWVVWRTR